jgi:SAM-dependent methyltransferase
LIRHFSKIKPKTLLYLGCGAGIKGINDYTFKKYFKVTGVDISNGMLKIDRELNAEVKYIHGDMREIRLKTLFDAVAIPDSIGYMAAVKDLRKAINTAYRHLNTGGLLLIIARIRDNFKENNFLYTGSKKDTRITIFENNCITNKTNYEATLVYLIRRKTKLKIYTDKHTIGLFNLTTRR